MRDDDDFGHYVPVLRRIIILVAVITAIPVVLWTITAFVRAYVSPPKMPTFHQLAATASANPPPSARAKDDPVGPPQPASQQTKKLAPVSSTIEAQATAPDARDLSSAPKGPFLGDRAPENAAPASITPPPAVSPPAISAQKAAELLAASMPAVKHAEPPTPAMPAPAAPDSMPARMAAADAQAPASAAEASADATASTPATDALTGPIPLPRHRPHMIAAAEPAPAAPAAERTRIASAGPIPMPRPRPDAAGPGAPATDSASGSPLDFIQNLFSGK
jgi:hypothetical protein